MLNLLKNFSGSRTLALLLVGLASAAPAVHAKDLDFQQCPQFFAGATPVLPAAAPKDLRAICFSEFAVLHSGETKTPVFAAERLSRAKLQSAKSQSRTDNFYEEARLPKAHRAWLRDYAEKDDEGKRRYDRGHVAPAGDMATVEGMAQSFSLANMVPQVPSNNRGPWRKIEEATRNYVMRASGDVYVVTGAVFAGPRVTTGPGEVRVPSSMYKLVYDASTKRSWAHWLDNTATAKIGKPISVEELQNRTGIDFYGNRVSD